MDLPFDLLLFLFTSLRPITAPIQHEPRLVRVCQDLADRKMAKKVVKSIAGKDSERNVHTSASGVFDKIWSILRRISGVSLGTTSIALRFSVICSGFDAPRITVAVFSFFATHARANAVVLVWSSVRQTGQKSPGILQTTNNLLQQSLSVL